MTSPLAKAFLFNRGDEWWWEVDVAGATRRHGASSWLRSFKASLRMHVCVALLPKQKALVLPPLAPLPQTVAGSMRAALATDRRPFRCTRMAVSPLAAAPQPATPACRPRSLAQPGPARRALACPAASLLLTESVR